MDPILELGFTTAVIEGTEWKMYRRCTAIMSAAAGVSKVLGAASAVLKDKPQTSVDTAKGVEFIEAVLRRALVEPRIAAEDEESVPGKVYQYDEIKHVHDALFAHHMASGLSAEVFPKPCEEKKGEPSQGH